MRPCWIAVLVLCLATPFHTAPAQAGEQDARVDRAIERALRHLKARQDEDGSWNDRFGRGNAGITSLVLLAFLSAGHVPGEGPYAATLDRGIRWVLEQQQDNGLIATDRQTEMYQHGIATLLLAEVAGMTDRDLGRKVRTAVQKAVRVILAAQRTEGGDQGGWRYRVAHVQGSDMSVTGWQIMALRAARNIGCDVPADAIDDAVAYVKRCQDPRTGGFCYTSYGQVTEACTGIGVLALELCGKKEHRSEAVLRGGAFLIRSESLPRWNGPFFFYAIYYGSQATFQLGGNYWDAYRPRLQEVLLRNQSSSGAWQGQSQDALFGGRNYCTAMATLALTVEYRFLPIYQRGEDRPERPR
jgi:squalene cyclase